MSALMNCENGGVAHLKIAKRDFTVPRVIIRTVVLPNGEYATQGVCEDTPLETVRLHLRIPRNTTGPRYPEWMHNNQWPDVVDISARGRIKNFSDQFMLWAKTAGRPVTHDANGYDVADYGAETLYDASPLGLVGYEVRGSTRCISVLEIRLRTAAIPAIRIIDTTKRSIPPTASKTGFFPRSEWLSLDARVRELLNALESGKFR